MPCVELFEEQDAAYKNAVMPKAVTKRLVVEAGITFGWHKYADRSLWRIGSWWRVDGEVRLFTVDNVYNRAKALLA